MDAKIKCDSTEFYLQQVNDRIEWFILLIESYNCIGKGAIQSAWNIERTERSLRDLSRNLSTEGKRLQRERDIFSKELSPLVDCSSSIHRRKILKVTALSKNVNIKSHKETSKYMWRRHADFHKFASTCAVFCYSNLNILVLYKSRYLLYIYI